MFKLKSFSMYWLAKVDPSIVFQFNTPSGTIVFIHMVKIDGVDNCSIDVYDVLRQYDPKTYYDFVDCTGSFGPPRVRVLGTVLNYSSNCQTLKEVEITIMKNIKKTNKYRWICYQANGIPFRTDTTKITCDKCFNRMNYCVLNNIYLKDCCIQALDKKISEAGYMASIDPYKYHPFGSINHSRRGDDNMVVRFST